MKVGQPESTLVLTLRKVAMIHYWQKLPDGIDALEFATKMLDPSIAVVCTPGPWISDVCADGSNPGEGYVRFSMVPSLADTNRACEAMLNNRELLLG